MSAQPTAKGEAGPSQSRRAATHENEADRSKPSSDRQTQHPADAESSESGEESSDGEEESDSDGSTILDSEEETEEEDDHRPSPKSKNNRRDGDPADHRQKGKSQHDSLNGGDTSKDRPRPSKKNDDSEEESDFSGSDEETGTGSDSQDEKDDKSKKKVNGAKPGDEHEASEKPKGNEEKHGPEDEKKKPSDPEKEKATKPNPPTKDLPKPPARRPQNPDPNSIPPQDCFGFTCDTGCSDCLNGLYAFLLRVWYGVWYSRLWGWLAWWLPPLLAPTLGFLAVLVGMTGPISGLMFAEVEKVQMGATGYCNASVYGDDGALELMSSGTCVTAVAYSIASVGSGFDSSAVLSVLLLWIGLGKLLDTAMDRPTLTRSRPAAAYLPPPNRSPPPHIVQPHLPHLLLLHVLHLSVPLRRLRPPTPPLRPVPNRSPPAAAAPSASRHRDAPALHDPPTDSAPTPQPGHDAHGLRDRADQYRRRGVAGPNRRSGVRW